MFRLTSKNRSFLSNDFVKAENNQTFQTTTITHQQFSRHNSNFIVAPSYGIKKRSISRNIPFRCDSPILPKPSRSALITFYNETGNECLNTLTFYEKCDCSHLLHR